ncbi:hypothetical protein [Acinetobacter sp. YH12255]|uniref:hypothetical protein n=1 Tax=Acinetobacter sp. YH12255 TaxID=2601179 RepID=UPI00359FBB2D
MRSTTYPSYALNLAQLGALCISNLCATKPAYAIGNINVAVNIWPEILKYLNEKGLYSRSYISHILLALNLTIPFLCIYLAGLKFNYNQKNYLYLLLICTIYPTLFFYSLDIFRDVFMTFSFLIGCLAVKNSLSNSNFFSFLFFYILAILIGIFLLKLRPYLGYAFLLALFLWKVKFTKKRVILFSFLYFISLFLANYIGFFNILTEYRSGFEEGSGGSTLGLNFSNPMLFIPNLMLSTLGQLFGLYVTNPFAVILLLVETVPFFAMLVYLVKNIKLADSFVRFLIIFFVLYASVWLIGNDNLGTAVRLRMYNYLVVYICFFYILKVKENIKYQVVNK